MLVTFKRNITITSYFKIKVITTTNLLFTVIYYFSVTLQIEKFYASTALYTSTGRPKILGLQCACSEYR